VEVTEHKKTNANMVKFLINNAIFAIKINAYMLSVQDIYDHLAAYTIPESWLVQQELRL
jgi:hypothetical protein